MHCRRITTWYIGDVRSEEYMIQWYPFSTWFSSNCIWLHWYILSLLAENGRIRLTWCNTRINTDCFTGTGIITRFPSSSEVNLKIWVKQQIPNHTKQDIPRKLVILFNSIVILYSFSDCSDRQFIKEMESCDVHSSYWYIKEHLLKFQIKPQTQNFFDPKLDPFT